MSGSRSLIVSTSSRISSRSTTLRPIRKKSYLKSQLGIYVGTDHITWVEKLPTIRFAMNTARCGTTDYTAAYFTFGRELRTSDDANRELRAENFLPEIIPKLLALADTMKIAKENQKRQQDDRKAYTDRHRRPNPGFQTDDIVWVNTHTLCRKKQQYTSKLAPRRDGPYVIRRQLGPNSYEVQTRDSEPACLGIYYTSSLTPYVGRRGHPPVPVVPIRRRGRPCKGRPDDHPGNQRNCQRRG